MLQNGKVEGPKGKRHSSLPLTTNLSQRFTEPSKGIRYLDDDLCRHSTKLTGPSDFTLHSHLIPQIDGTF